MKQVFVVGFSPAVKRDLDGSFARHCQNGSVVWVSEGQGAGADIAKFKELFLSQIIGKKPTEVLVLFAVPTANQWLEPQLQRLVGDARGRFSHVPIALQIFRDFGASAQVKNRLIGFDLPNPDRLDITKIAAKLGGAKVICVVAAGRPTILEALTRAGVPCDALAAFFEQEVIETGRNSTLMEHLERHAKSYGHMLYAWGALRTSSKGLVKGFKKKGIFYEAESAGKVAELLRKYLSSE